MATVKKRQKRVPVQLFPVNAQKAYTSALIQIVDDGSHLIKTHIFPKIDPMLNQAKLHRPTTDSIKMDILSDQIEQSVNTAELELTSKHPDSQLEKTAFAIALLIASHNKREVTKILSAIKGVSMQNIFLTETYLDPEISLFVKQNVKLIKTIPSQLFRETEGIVFRGIQQGLSHTAIKKQLTDRIEISRNRAKLIARDQTGKLNAQLTQLRQQSVGVKRYIWRTIGDERVRGNPVGRYAGATPSHYLREGKVFKWSSAPSDGHPGQAIQCRCYAEPIL